jgi:hypothetical protein
MRFAIPFPGIFGVEAGLKPASIIKCVPTASLPLFNIVKKTKKSQKKFVQLKAIYSFVV